MLDLGLSGVERRAFHELLNGSWKATTDLEILDGDGDVVATIEDKLLSGSVSLSVEAPTRQLEIEFVNTGKKFRFVPGGPDDAALFANNLIRAFRVFDVPALDRRIRVPVFTGPIRTCEPNDRTVRVTALGKESDHLDPALAWHSQKFGRKTKATDAIREIMRAGGERSFDIPDLDATLRKPVSVGRKSERWKVCKRIADSIDRQLFFDGRGKLRLRHVPMHPLWTFRHGSPNANVTSNPTPSYERDDLRNTIEVLGPEPEGSKKRLRYVATPLKGDPLSPWSLGRNGEPLHLVTSIDMAHAKTMEELRKRAERELEDALSIAITNEFEALVVPHLEVMDMCVLITNGERFPFRLREATIPLQAGPMSVNYRRRPKTRRKG